MAECADHRQFAAQCNAMGGDRWELVALIEPHGFLAGVFKRPALDDDDESPHQLNHSMLGNGVFDLSPPQPVQPDEDRRKAAEAEPEPTGFAQHAVVEQDVLEHANPDA